MKIGECPIRAAPQFLMITVFSFAIGGSAEAATRLPKGDPKPPILVDFPPPHDFQGSAVGKSAALSWSWVPPAEMPTVMEFGFEVERQDGPRWVSAEMALKDFDVTYGTYTYRIRSRARWKDRGSKVTHLSPWVGPLVVEIPVVCPLPPVVQMKIDTPERRMTGTPALRLHLVGNVLQPAECRSPRVFYTVDSGTGINATGPLTLNDNGKFDTFIDALHPGDEIPVGVLDFSVTATAENETGVFTTPPARVRLQLENQFAPKDPF
jgi:hypothetical protein